MVMRAYLIIISIYRAIKRAEERDEEILKSAQRSLFVSEGYPPIRAYKEIEGEGEEEGEGEKRKKEEEERRGEAERVKEEGNRLFQQKRFAEAKEKYSLAISLSPSPVYYANRAETHLRLNWC